MPGNIKKLYSQFLNLNEKKESKKCKARKKNCECGYHYKKGDGNTCPQCKSKRETCNNWASPGKEVCVKHGSRAGRKMTTGQCVTTGTFTVKEWDQIKENIQSKNREHEFAYQVATAAFKKITNTIDDPMMILGAATEYFSKIARYINDIDTVESKMIHIHTFDEVEKEKLQTKIREITDKVLKNCLFIIVAILKRKITDNTLYDQIYSEIPEAYRRLIEDKQKELGAGK